MLAASPPPCVAGEKAEDLVHVHAHDFDEDLDADGQPDLWVRTVDADHPHYVEAGLDFSTSCAGGGSLKIIAGGANAEFQSPWIEVEQQAAYDVSGFLKTENLASEGLRASKAFIEVRLFDRKRAPVASVKGFPQATGTTDWTGVSVMDVARGKPTAAFLRVALVLEGRSLEGAAWFDSVEIKKRPVAFLTSNHAGNIFQYSDAKVLSFESRGLPGGSWNVAFTVEDERGDQVHSVSLAAETDEEGTLCVSYPLPTLPAGPYRVTVEVSNGIASGLTHAARIGVLPDYKHRPGRNFGISLGAFPADPGAALELALDSGVGWIKMPLAGEAGESTSARLRTVAEFRRFEIMPVGVLEAPALQQAGEDPDEIDWIPIFGQTINSFAGMIEYWQLGGDGSPRVPAAVQVAAFGDLKRFIDEISFTSLCGLAAERSDAASPPAEAAFLSLDAAVFESIADEQENGRPPGGVRYWVWLEPTRWNYGDPQAAMAGLAKQASRLFRLGAEAVFFKDPWQRQGMVDGEGNISSFGLAVLNLIHQLAGFTYAGAISLPGGTPNAIFTRGDETLVLLWPGEEPHEERIFLGDAVETIDIYGRRRQTPLEKGQNVLTVRDAPVLLSGVNPAVVRTRQTFRIEPRVVDSIYQLQPIFVSFANEFDMSIVGELSVQFPKLWEARPDKFFVRLKPGEVFRKRTNLLVPYNALSGPREVTISLDLGGAGTQKTTVIRHVELGSTAFEMEISLRSSGADLAVYQKVSNISDNLVNVTAFLEGEQLKRIEQPPRDLAAGSTTTFLYKLPGAKKWTGKTLRATVRDRFTDKFLNHEFTVPEDVGLR